VRRRTPLIIGGLALASLVPALVYADHQGRAHPVEATVFDAATSFCGEHRGQPFLQQATDVAATSRQLRPTVARVEAEFLAQLEGLDDVPDEARPLLRDLRLELSEGARSGDFRRARRTAAELDDLAATACG